MQYYISCAVCLVTQLCPTLYDSMDCSLLGFSVLGNSPGKNTGVGRHALLQGIYPTQGKKPGVPHCRRILYHLSHQGSPFKLLCESNPGQPELHKFPSSQRETYHFHRVTQSFPLLEWHWHLAPSPVVIAGSTCFISQNVLCLLQFLKSFHWKTNQKMSMPWRYFKRPNWSHWNMHLLFTSYVTLGQFTSSSFLFLIYKVYCKDKWDNVCKVPGSQFIHSLYWAPVMWQVLSQVLMMQIWATDIIYLMG